MPPLTVENTSALIGGVRPKEQDMQEKPRAQHEHTKVKVLRAFQDHLRQILKPGAVAELPRIFALEMQAAKKVEILPTDEPAPEKPRKESKKESTNAG